MSESREHKRRYNRRLEFIAAFEKWTAQEPARWRMRQWHRWLNARPVWAQFEHDSA